MGNVDPILSPPPYFLPDCPWLAGLSPLPAVLATTTTPVSAVLTALHFGVLWLIQLNPPSSLNSLQEELGLNSES